MNTLDTLDTEELVIKDLHQVGHTILTVMDQDSEKALHGDAEAVAAINVNLRVLSAINEVLIYYGDEGLFADGELL